LKSDVAGQPVIMPRLYSDVGMGKSWSLKSRLIGEKLTTQIEKKEKKIIHHDGKKNMRQT